MSIQSDFLAYTDQYGLVQPDGTTSQNGILFTTEAILALIANDALDENSRQSYIAAIKSCQKEEGLYKRAPNNEGDQEAPDDYYALGAASLFLGSDMAASVLKYGRIGASRWSESTEKPENKYSKLLYSVLSLGGLLPVKWVWNNIDPGGFSQDSWIGRQQNLVCHLQWAAGEEPPLWRKLWWCIAIIQGAQKDASDHDGWILAWLCVRVMGDKSWFCKLVADYWWKKFLKLYPEGMGSCIAAYFANPNHPTAKWLGLGK